MTVNQLEEVLYFMDEFRYATIFDILNRFPYLGGTYEWRIKSNVVIGKNLSKEAIQFLIELVRAKIIIAFPSIDAPQYEEQSAYPYAIAKGINYNYHHPRWFPLTFSTFDKIRMDGLKNIHLINLQGSSWSSPPIL